MGRFPNEPVLGREFAWLVIAGWLGLNPAGGRGTDRCAAPPEKPPRDWGALVSGMRDCVAGLACGMRDCGAALMGGRGILCAICVVLPRPICELLSSGRCPTLLFPGRGTPRNAGDGTGPEALCGPCGIIRDGVSAPDWVRPANDPWLFMAAVRDAMARLKLAGGVMRETTERIPLRAGGAAAG